MPTDEPDRPDRTGGGGAGRTVGAASFTSTRTMVVVCDAWPVLAQGCRPEDPAAVVFANRVVACTPQAARHGLAVGQRRREAQGRCPALEVIERDEGREARAFEAVVRAVETFTPRIELTRPGACAFPTRGPSRYFGGDEALARLVRDAVDAVLADRGWPGWVRVGVADGPFAARLAAREHHRPDHHRSDGGPTSGIRIVAPGATPAFLAPQPVGVLAHGELQGDDLTGVLVRLGLTTLGDLAALDPGDVLARFGREGAHALRLARGCDDRPPDARDPPPDLEVSIEIDPPAERVDQVAFLAKSLADELFATLAARGLSCTRVLVSAETEHGEISERTWRHEGSLTAGAVTDRVRWQLDGWLHGSAHVRPTSGVMFLRLVPDEVIPAHGRQLGFWGGETDADLRATRALARVQGLLGPEAVSVPEWRGRRGPAEQLVLVPAGAVDLSSRPAAHRSSVTSPWPGRLPAPAPAVVPVEPPPADVVDGAGRPVCVSARAMISAPPVRVAIGGGPWRRVDAWAGPWPSDERWWDPASRRRRARVQVVLEDGTAHVLTLESGCWSVEATYD